MLRTAEIFKKLRHITHFNSFENNKCYDRKRPLNLSKLITIGQIIV